ncbi:unnamed protein product [Sphagnum tenellum]
MNDSTTQEVSQKAPIRCLIIQLARFGDTIQSLMALRAAKQLYPQLEIHFLAREKFSDAAKKVSWLSGVITFPTEELLGPHLSGKKDETQTIAEIAGWLAPLLKDTWDMVVNWTFSESSSYLTALIPAKVKLGYSRKNDSTFLGADGWSHYIQAIIQEDIRQNVHLTDILTTQLLTALQIHAGDPSMHSSSAACGSSSQAGETSVSSKGFFSLSIQAEEGKYLSLDPSKKWIAFQLNSSEHCQHWPMSYFANLAGYITTRNPEWGIILLGLDSDRDKETQFFAELDSHAQGSRSILSLVGMTSFDLWVSVISKCQWLVSEDTAAIHLASVLGTRVLNFSFGTHTYDERGPYGTGHYVITSSAPSSNTSINARETGGDTRSEKSAHEITPEAAYLVWLHGANEWALKGQVPLEIQALKLGWKECLKNIKILRSRIRDTNDGGGVIYDSVLKRPIDIDDWCAMVMGYVARSWYCGWIPPLGKELTREEIDPLLIQKLRELGEATEVLVKICEKGHQTALTLHRKTSSMKSDKIMGVQDRQELRDLGRTLMELETLLDRLTKTQPNLLSFAKMSKVLMHHLKGDLLTDLGKETANSYIQLKEGVQIFINWTKYTLDLSKPKVLTVQTLPCLERISP